MPKGPTAKRYAQAAFAIARDAGEIEGWLEDLQLARETLGDETLRMYLEGPKVALGQKVQVLRTALGNVRPLVLNLVALLTSRYALGRLPQIVVEYQRLVDAHFNRERAEVVTAVPLEDQQQERLSRQLAQLLGREVVITTRVHPEVLGGLVARVGDRIIDGSVRGRLTDLRKSLSEVSG